MPCRGMQGQRAVPAPCNGQRAVHVDQLVLLAAQQEKRGGWRLPRCPKAGGGHKLSQDVGKTDRTHPPDVLPTRQFGLVLFWLVAGHLQYLGFYLVRCWAQYQHAHQSGETSWSKPMLQRAEGAKAGIDQDGSCQFVWRFAGPLGGHHGAHGHAQYPVGRLMPQTGKLHPAMGNQGCDVQRTGTVVQRAIARQVNCDDPGARQGALKSINKTTPVAAFAGQTAQKDPQCHS